MTDIDTPPPTCGHVPSVHLAVPACPSREYVESFSSTIRDRIQASAARLVVVDLHHVQEIALPMLGRLVAAHRAAKEGGAEFVLVCVRQSVRDQLRTAKLDRLIPIATDYTAAVEAFGGKTATFRHLTTNTGYPHD